MLNSDQIGLLFKMRGDSEDAQRASRELKNRIERDSREIEGDLSGIGKGAESAGRAFDSFIGNLAADAVANLTNYLADAAKAVLDFSARMEQTRIGFASLLGNADKANKLLKQLQDFARTTPFEFEGITKLAQRFLAANIEAEKIIPLMRDIGNIVAATGDTTIERVEGIGVALSQVISKGTVSAEEMEQLAERGIPAWQFLAEAIGKTVAETRKLAEDGRITSNVLVDALQKISRERFGDAMAKQAQTFRGATTIIKDSLLQTAATAFEPLYNEISQLAARFAKEIQAQKGDLQKVGETVAKYIGEGLGLGIASVLNAFAAYIGRRLNEIFTEGKVVDSITHKLTKGLIDSFLINLGLMSRTPQQTGPRVIDYSGASADPARVSRQSELFLQNQNAAEQARKEQEERARRDTNALIQIWQNYLQDLYKSFDTVFEQIRERFKQTGNAEEFRANLEAIINIYKDKAFEANGALLNLEKLLADQQKKTQGERLALAEDQSRRENEIIQKYKDAQIETEKAITEAAKKQSLERIKISEAEAERKIKAEERSTRIRLAELERDRVFGAITEREFIVATGRLKIQQLENEREQIKSIIQTDENRIEIQERLKEVEAQLSLQTIENAQKIFEYNKRINDQLLERHRLMGIEAGREEGAPTGDGEGAGPSTSIFDSFDRLEEMLENETPLKLADQFRAMGDIITGAFLDISGAIAQTVQEWVLYGETGPAVMRKILASALATIAAEAAVQAIYATALGFLRLAQWDFTGAANAFTSAAIWASIAGVAAIAGRAVAGDAFRRETAGGFGSQSAGGGSRSSGQSRDAQIIEQGRNAPVAAAVTLSIKDKSDWFSEMFQIEIEKNGRVRQAILNLQNV